MTDRSPLYLEDLKPGQVFRSSMTVSVDTAAIKRFAGEFDPQPFHLDEAAAANRCSPVSPPAAGTPRRSP